MTDVPAVFYFTAAGGAAIAALGAFILGVRPRTAASTWLGLFALGLGVKDVVSQGVFYILHAPEVVRALFEVPAAILSVVALVALALVFPRPLAGKERKDAAVTAAVGVALFALFVAYRLLARPGRPPLQVFIDMGTAPAWVAVGPFVLLLALRCRRSHEAPFRRQLALTAAGPTLHFAHYAVYGTLIGGAGSILYADGPRLAYQLAASGLFLVIALLWLSATGGPGGRAARNMSWLTLGVMLVALVIASARATFGISGILMAAFLAYAVLRQQILGIDVKVRWGISKSTIAAVFIAVFFIASEAAQQFVGETLQSTYLGIAAAGALVFAFAPLQRAAERLAEKAVPIAEGPTPPARSAHEDAYRAAVRLALRGGITRREEFDLAKIAEAHGIAPVRALELRDEMERARAEAPE